MIARLRGGSPLLTNVALGVLGAILLGLSRHLAVEFDHFVWGYSETSMFAMAAALGAAWIVYAQPVNRATIWIIAVFAVLCRLTLLTPEPYLSSDIYRYVWDGMVQHHGVNPYRYFPGNEHLKALRDDDIFPNINRRDYAPTIYPPVAQMFFFCVTWVSATLTMMKLAMMAMEAVTVFALVRLLVAFGRRREEVILYAWSPLCIWEFGSSGHLDAAVIAAVVLALLFRWRNWPVLTGLAIGAAIMLKFYPLVLLPALWRRWDWKMPATVAAVVAGGYAVYIGVGMKVFGFAGGYVAEEGMDSGSRYFLFDLLHRAPGLHGLPIGAYFVFCVVCFLPLLWWCWRNSGLPVGTTVAERAGFVGPAALLAFGMMLLFSPHYPWYVAWLLPFIVLVPVPVLSLPMLVYVYSVWWWLTTEYSMPGPGLFYANKWVYGATLVTGLAAYGWQRRGRTLLVPAGV